MFLKDNYTDRKYAGARKSRDVLLNGFTSSLTTSSALGGLVSQAFKVPAKYYLEIRKSEEILAVMTFPYDPSFVNYSRPTPGSLTYTLGGIVRNSNTIRRHNISLSGRSGLGQRVAYTRSGGLLYAEGEDVFQEFDEFFKKYSEICASEYGLPNHIGNPSAVFSQFANQEGLNGGSSSNIIMVLRCLDEDLHLKVEPLNFSWSKSAEANRFDYVWNCEFIAYGYAEKYTNVVLDVLDRIDAEVNALGGSISAVSNVIDNISNDYVTNLRKTIRNAAGPAQAIRNIGASGQSAYSNVLGIKSDAVNALKQYKFISDAVGDAFTAIGEFFTPEDTTPGIGRQVSNIQEIESQSLALSTLSEPLVTTEKEQDDLGNVINSINLIQNRAEIIRGSIPRKFYTERINNINNVFEESPQGGEFLSNEINFGIMTEGRFFGGPEEMTEFQNNMDVHYLMRDDDLLTVAAKYLGNPDRWIELARINKWRDSRRGPDGKLPAPGTKILIPKSIQPLTNPYGDPNDSIGIDLSMPFDDIRISSDGDFVLTRENNNINQYVKNVLMTKSGEIFGYKSFGVPIMPNVTNITYAAAVVRESLMRDDRILDVSNIVIESDGDTLIVTCDVKPKKGDNISIKTLVS